MSRGQIPMDAFGECHNDSCDYPLPWDMSAIAINGNHAFCSPKCARAFLKEPGEPVETVTLHDPQYRGYRPDGVSDDSVTVWREVEGATEAYTTLNDLEVIYGGPFTVE